MQVLAYVHRCLGYIKPDGSPGTVSQTAWVVLKAWSLQGNDIVDFTERLARIRMEWEMN